MELLLGGRCRGSTGGGGGGIHEVTVIRCNSMLGAHGKSRRWQQALGLLMDMPQRPLEPDQISFNSAISACGRGGQWR
ncbi:unnamed protein product, partial [Polarella glacialis]